MLSPLLPLKNTISNSKRPLSWFFLIVFTIYAWSQSTMFVFEYYLGQHWASTLSGLLLLYLALHLISVLYVKTARIFLPMALLYIGIMFLYALLELSLDDESLLFKGILKTSIVTLLMLRIITTDKSLNRLILINFFFGFVAILLNTVPLLAASGFIDLHGTSITRVGGETLRPDLDPISYGIFGLTENHESPNTYFPRLQGWSPEPQIWGYLVFNALGIGVLAAKLIRNNIIAVLLLLFIIIHIYFIGSTSAYLSLVVVFAGFSVLIGLNRLYIAKLNNWRFLFLMILIPGLIIPFCMGLIAEFKSDFLLFDLMEEGDNWIQKLSFLDYGDELYFRVTPSPSDGLHSSHNFILNTYLDFGYIFLFPLVYLFYRFSCVAVSLPN